MVDKLHVVRDEYVFNDYASHFVVAVQFCYCFLLGVVVRLLARALVVFLFSSLFFC